MVKPARPRVRSGWRSPYLWAFFTGVIVSGISSSVGNAVLATISGVVATAAFFFWVQRQPWRRS